MMRAPYWTRTVSVAIVRTSINSRMTFMVDDSSDAARSLEPERSVRRRRLRPYGIRLGDCRQKGQAKEAKAADKKQWAADSPLRRPLLVHHTLKITAIAQASPTSAP